MPDGVPRADEAGSLVTLRGVSKHIGLVQVLNGIDLDLTDGQVTALLGPVGAGKSTLCRALAGSERIDSGSITVAGQPLRRRRRYAGTGAEGRGGVGPVADPGSLLAHRTVLQNVVHARRTGLLRRLGSADGERRALALLERVGAAEYAAHYPWELSGERQQRVAIARALATAPRLVLVDEPTVLPPAGTAGMPGAAGEPDAGLSEAVAPPALPLLLRGLAADGLAVLVATGDPAFARCTADRVVFMEGGRIIEQGPPEEFFTTPRTVRARDFLSAAAKPS
ncbi:amino acid ABC transporter ATP-binding protein [Streptacidiphilus sp. N1-12]|uniref:Amino acid ABC transporter ATP-binding protein n=2 Tax=Streptacidiphilus alkalitolerans TaxID=3342712 RepID=A0ABV6WS70_9ACTN